MQFKAYMQGHIALGSGICKGNAKRQGNFIGHCILGNVKIDYKKKIVYKYIYIL